MHKFSPHPEWFPLELVLFAIQYPLITGMQYYVSYLWCENSFQFNWISAYMCVLIVHMTLSPTSSCLSLPPLLPLSLLVSPSPLSLLIHCPPLTPFFLPLLSPSPLFSFPHLSLSLSLPVSLTRTHTDMHARTHQHHTPFPMKVTVIRLLECHKYCQEWQYV